MSEKFCPKCGNKLEPETSFCNACGADLRIRAETPSKSSPELKETTQEPKLKPKRVIYAYSLKRIIAQLFDSIFIILIGSAFSWLLVNPWLPINFFDPFRAWWFTFPFDWLAGFLYHWLMEAHNKGQTLGKMALSIRTVDEKTLEQADSRNLAINNIFKGSPLLLLDLLIGWIKNSRDPKKRLRIMQYASETVVIFVK
ncbi:MAG: RDD family protein [Promethearchaeota archaeon]|jgi:uncharacterized RDD family membrane protein YckC